MNQVVGPLLLSLQVAICASSLVVAIAVPLAFLLGGVRSVCRSVLDALIVVPLVLPPTVVGYFILVIMGRRGWVGSYLDEWFGYSIMFHWHGAVLAAAVVAFPLAYLPARAAFAAISNECVDAARLQGAGTLALFWHVSLPMAGRGIITGFAMAFARALGEFGATMMVMGDTARYRTLPLVVYSAYDAGETSLAALAVILLTTISLAVMLLYNRSAASS